MARCFSASCISRSFSSLFLLAFPALAAASLHGEAARAAVARARTAAAAGAPEQVSLALTANGGEMSVTWVSSDAWSASSSGFVTWAPTNTTAADTAPAATLTYSAGVLGWTGTIFQATMTGLAPSSSYTYTVSANGIAGVPHTFVSAPIPDADAPARFAVLADMGTVELFGFDVAAALIKEHAAEPFDMAFIAGDLAYATVDPPKNEFEHLFDAWGLQNEPFSSTMPFMMTVGNHESTPGTMTNASGTFPQPFAAFSTRWRMPANGVANYQFSYTWGPCQFVSINSEADLSNNSPQWLWLESQLSSADRSVTPWLFVVLHRPIISADKDESGDHVPGSPRSDRKSVV